MWLHMLWNHPRHNSPIRLLGLRTGCDYHPRLWKWRKICCLAWCLGMRPVLFVGQCISHQSSLRVECRSYEHSTRMLWRPLPHLLSPFKLAYQYGLGKRIYVWNPIWLNGVNLMLTFFIPLDLVKLIPTPELPNKGWLSARGSHCVMYILKLDIIIMRIDERPPWAFSCFGICRRKIAILMRTSGAMFSQVSWETE